MNTCTHRLQLLRSMAILFSFTHSVALSLSHIASKPTRSVYTPILISMSYILPNSNWVFHISIWMKSTLLPLYFRWNITKKYLFEKHPLTTLVVAIVCIIKFLIYHTVFSEIGSMHQLADYLICGLLRSQSLFHIFVIIYCICVTQQSGIHSF